MAQEDDRKQSGSTSSTTHNPSAPCGQTPVASFPLAGSEQRSPDSHSDAETELQAGSLLSGD